MAVPTRAKIAAALVTRPGVLQLDADGKLSSLTLSYIRSLLLAIVDRINGLLSFGTGASGSWAGNLDAQFLDVTARSANAEFPIPHGLGRVPVGYIIVRTNAASILYDNGGGNWTDSTLYLLSTDAGSVFRILIF